MSSTSETGHAKNVANFASLISYCTAYSEAYNPSKEELTITSLNTLHELAISSLLNVKNDRQTFSNATNERQIQFEGYKILATRIYNALGASGASKQSVADAETINKKIQGAKANSTKRLAPEPTEENADVPTNKSISVSQQSYDSITDHFTKLQILAEKEIKYQPNEADLKVAALQAKIVALQSSNTLVINSLTNWSNAMIYRDAVLYAPETGLVDITKLVKKYVKSVFKATSPQFKQINNIEFKIVKSK